MLRDPVQLKLRSGQKVDVKVEVQTMSDSFGNKVAAAAAATTAHLKGRERERESAEITERHMLRLYEAAETLITQSKELFANPGTVPICLTACSRVTNPGLRGLRRT